MVFYIKPHPHACEVRASVLRAKERGKGDTKTERARRLIRDPQLHALYKSLVGESAGALAFTTQVSR